MLKLVPKPYFCTKFTRLEYVQIALETQKTISKSEQQISITTKYYLSGRLTLRGRRLNGSDPSYRLRVDKTGFKIDMNVIRCQLSHSVWLGVKARNTRKLKRRHAASSMCIILAIYGIGATFQHGRRTRLCGQESLPTCTRSTRGTTTYGNNMMWSRARKVRTWRYWCQQHVFLGPGSGQSQ